MNCMYDTNDDIGLNSGNERDAKISLWKLIENSFIFRA